MFLFVRRVARACGPAHPMFAGGPRGQTRHQPEPPAERRPPAARVPRGLHERGQDEFTQRAVRSRGAAVRGRPALRDAGPGDAARAAAVGAGLPLDGHRRVHPAPAHEARRVVPRDVGRGRGRVLARARRRRVVAAGLQPDGGGARHRRRVGVRRDAAADGVQQAGRRGRGLGRRIGGPRRAGSLVRHARGRRRVDERYRRHVGVAGRARALLVAVRARRPCGRDPRDRRRRGRGPRARGHARRRARAGRARREAARVRGAGVV
mmetsp:Transcript_10155/g.30713  ORF Transcript_10155/g.30713 Transcript_10155/m.30713 type:complete len:264 (+) Transcript_10155:584-1375(+)